MQEKEQFSFGTKFHGLHSSSDSPVILYAFGEAGRGAGAWNFLLKRWSGIVDIRIARLPGRESRYDEELLTTVGAQIADLSPALSAFVNSDSRPFILLGICAGAINAFEMARVLNHPIARSPQLLVVIDQLAPMDLAGNIDPIHDFDEFQFKNWCEDNLADRAELRDEEVFRFFEPVLRADFSAMSSYSFDKEPMLDCPLLMVSANNADSMQKSNWESVTTGEFRSTQLPSPVTIETMDNVVKMALSWVMES